MIKRGTATEILVGLVPIALLLGLWHGLAAGGFAPPALLPSPGAVMLRLVDQLRNPVFLEHAAITALRLFTGFALAVVIGIGLGVAATGNRVVAAMLRPLIRVLAPVPKVALYPALILVLGFDHSSKVALV